MARNTDVGGGSLSGLWRRPLAGGRSIDGWMDDRTERLLQGIAILTGALAGVIAERRIENAKAAAHLSTATLEDDFDHLITRLEADSQYLSERHLRRLKHVTNDPRVVAALREANLPLKENGT